MCNETEVKRTRNRDQLSFRVNACPSCVGKERQLTEEAQKERDDYSAKLDEANEKIETLRDRIDDLLAENRKLAENQP
jgi:DNA repair exonuclease SbcCD ATPase subunit